MCLDARLREMAGRFDTLLRHRPVEKIQTELSIEENAATR